MHVWAVGDSTLDLPMLEIADEAIAIADEEGNRSCSMNNVLLEAIKTRGLKAQQALLPRHASPRLTDAVLPQTFLLNERALKTIFSRRRPHRHMHANIWHATDKSVAKVLMSSTRKASIAGPILRKAHANVVTWHRDTCPFQDVIWSRFRSRSVVDCHNATQ